MTTLIPIERAMMWERMSGERLSDAERQRIMDGGDFVPPHMADTETTVDWSKCDAKLKKSLRKKALRLYRAGFIDKSRLAEYGINPNQRPSKEKS